MHLRLTSTLPAIRTTCYVSKRPLGAYSSTTVWRATRAVPEYFLPEQLIVQWDRRCRDHGQSDFVTRRTGTKIAYVWVVEEGQYLPSRTSSYKNAAYASWITASSDYYDTQRGRGDVWLAERQADSKSTQGASDPQYAVSS